MKNILISTLAVVMFGSVASAQSTDPVQNYELETGKRLSLPTLTQEKLAIYKIKSGKQTITVKVLPGGYIEILEGSTTLRLSVDTPNGKRITLNIGLSEGIALWPVSDFSLRGSDNFFIAGLSVADEFFTLKAIKTKRGIKVLAPTGEVTLRQSQRLEGNATTPVMSYRLVSKSFPGRKLELKSNLPTEENKQPRSTQTPTTTETQSWLPFSNLLLDFEDINDAARHSY